MPTEDRPATYRAFGVRIQASVELPELDPAPGAAPHDVRVVRGSPGPLPAEAWAEGEAMRIAAGPRHAWLHCERAGLFRVGHGRQVVFEPDSDADLHLLRFSLLGPVMSMVMLQRGLSVLHASAVEIDGRACVFLGASGSGKSTLAAALHAAGHAILTDDLLLVGPLPAAWVTPSYPQLKVLPEVAAALGFDPASLRPVFSFSPERAIRCPGDPGPPVPLGAVYLVVDGPALSVRRLGSSEGCVRLLASAYASRRVLACTGRLAAFFELCSAIARSVPVWELSRPRSLALLPALGAFTARHARASYDLEGDSAAARPSAAAWLGVA